MYIFELIGYFISSIDNNFDAVIIISYPAVIVNNKLT